MASPDELESAPTARGPLRQASDVSLALRELSLAFRDHDRELAAQMSLKPQEYLAMEHILEGGGRLGPVELASLLGIAVPTTSELLDRLQQLGHVERHRDERDGRRVQLAPTAETVAAIIQAITPAMGLLNELADGYSPSEQQVIVRFLRDATAALKADATSGSRT